MSGRSAWRRLRADVGIGLEIDLHLGARRDDRADVAALDHDVALRGELTLPLAHHLAHLVVARDDRDHPVDARLADRRGHVGAGDEDAAVLVEGDRVLARELAERLAVAERQRLAHREPGERAVHRAGVEVAEAEPLGEPARDRALAAPPAVDGDDPTSSARGGNRDASLSAECPVERVGRGGRRSRGRIPPRSRRPRSATPSRETRPATAPSMAIRWSPRRLDLPPRGRVGTPVTEKPSVVPLGAHADRPQRVDDGLDAVGLLQAQLGGAVDPALAARARARAARRAAARRRAAAPRGA